MIARNLLIVIFLFCGPAQAQKIDFALAAADTTIRTLDMVSTRAMITSSCHCYTETDPIAPSGKQLLPVVAFQYGWSAGFIIGSRELHVHHHPRLGRVLIAADIVVESCTVAHNMRLQPPAATVAPLVVLPTRIRGRS